MIITLAIIGFAAIIVLVIYIPFRSSIHRWFADREYKSQGFVIIAVTIAVIAVVLVLFFVFSTDKSVDSGVADRPQMEDEEKSVYTLDIGTPIPPVVLPDTEGNTVDLSEQDDKLLVLSFWNTLCKYCAQQLPIFSRLIEETDGEAEIYLININEPLSVVQEYTVNEALEFDVLVDSDGEVGDVYQVRGTPTNFFVRNGIICGMVPGVISLETMKRTIEECKLVVPDEEGTTLNERE